MITYWLKQNLPKMTAKDKTGYIYEFSENIDKEIMLELVDKVRDLLDCPSLIDKRIFCSVNETSLEDEYWKITIELLIEKITHAKKIEKPKE